MRKLNVSTFYSNSFHMFIQRYVEYIGIFLSYIGTFFISYVFVFVPIVHIDCR
jgi:hypothetical protein